MPHGNANLSSIVAGMTSIQDQICTGLEALDGVAKFRQDPWQRQGGGGGITRCIENGRIIEKGGVNFSHVHGIMPEQVSTGLNLPAGLNFHATGVSIVLHSSHPFVPIIHMNVRYFEMENGQSWFGGGIDVTPAYVDRGQAIAFHQRLKATCDRHNGAFYDAYKPWADRYFHLKHRKESRGIGGIFFDQLTSRDQLQKDQNWAFVQDVAATFLPAYTELVTANQDRHFGEKELAWQAQRRSRYVEFNLLWDKGTRFGLETDGRTESILMSMPPMAKWAYDLRPELGSAEAESQALLQPIDWLGTGKPIPLAI